MSRHTPDLLALCAFLFLGREARNPIRQGEVILKGDLAARSK